MTYTISGVFRADLGSAADGLNVYGYAVSEWTGAAPGIGTAPPASPTPVPGSTDSAMYGSYGGWQLALPTNEDYYVCVQYPLDSDTGYYWQLFTAPAWTDDTIDGATELDVTTSASSGTINADIVNVGNDDTLAGQLTVLGTLTLGTDEVTASKATPGLVQDIGTANASNVTSSDIFAWVDHQHRGLGSPIGFNSSPPYATRYVSATSGNVAPSNPPAGGYALGDFTVDQSGGIWVYAEPEGGGAEWVELTQAGIGALTGQIMAYAGIQPVGGWIACDGTGYTEADYPALYAALITGTFTCDITSQTSVTCSAAIAALVQAGWPIWGPNVPADGNWTVDVPDPTGTSFTISGTGDVTTGDTTLLVGPWGGSYDLETDTWTFKAPDLRGRVGVGASSQGTNAQPTVPLGSSTYAVGGAAVVAGEAEHLLLSAESGSSAHDHYDQGHGHNADDPGHNHGFLVDNGTGGDSNPAPGSGTVMLVSYGENNTTGISITTGYAIINGTELLNAPSAHNNMQPFAGLTYIIKT